MGGVISEVEILSWGKNVAANAKYHLRPLPTSSEKYADTTAKLTDGIYTTSDFGQGRAVGWSKEQPCITIDLGSPTDIAKVSAHVLGGGPGGVWFPKKMSVATSLDGQKWETMGETTEHPPEVNNRFARGYMTVSAKPKKCRYARLQFDRHGWLMVDEIELFGPNATRSN